MLKKFFLKKNVQIRQCSLKNEWWSIGGGKWVVVNGQPCLDGPWNQIDTEIVGLCHLHQAMLHPSSNYNANQLSKFCAIFYFFPSCLKMNGGYLDITFEWSFDLPL